MIFLVEAALVVGLIAAFDPRKPAFGAGMFLLGGGLAMAWQLGPDWLGVVRVGAVVGAVFLADQWSRSRAKRS